METEILKPSLFSITYCLSISNCKIKLLDLQLNLFIVRGWYFIAKSLFINLRTKDKSQSKENPIKTPIVLWNRWQKILSRKNKSNNVTKYDYYYRVNKPNLDKMVWFTNIGEGKTV